MSSKRLTIIKWISLLACIFIGLQITFILYRGEALCLNESCRIVEKLTIIPSLYINIAGLLYFIALFTASCWPKNQLQKSPDKTLILLLLGLAVEGVLLSYQLFVIHAFCSYCLLIFTIIFTLNILSGWQQIRFAIPLLTAILATSAVLNFSPASLLALRDETLASGTAAVKKCDIPAKKLYFFFSADCPHCKNVLSVLENCNNCEFHFNPIDKNQTLAIPGLEFTPSYSSALNRVVLSMLEITTIPVLLAQNRDGLTFIKGEESIISYVSRTCFLQEQEISTEKHLYNTTDDINFFTEAEGECTIEVECPDETELLLDPAATQ